jgi:hypothetical protein
MKTTFVTTTLAIILAVASGICAQAPVPITPNMSQQAKVIGLQLAFAPNRGQAPPDVRFEAKSFGSALYFLSDQVLWKLPAASPEQPGGSAHMTLQFLGTQAEPEITGGKRLPGVVNYLVGEEPDCWLKNIPTYEEIVYQQLYPGIDLHFTGQQSASGEWSLKGTYTVAPGADPGRIRWLYSGADAVKIDRATGDLQITLLEENGPALVERAPVSWQEIGGKRVPVESRFVLAQDGSIQLAVGGYDPAYSLIIDPTLEFSTYLGTIEDENATGIAVDSRGNIVVVGYTTSTEFPVTPDAFQPVGYGGTCYSPPPFNIPFPCNDGFVTKITPDGSTLLYSTYLGGTADDGLSDLVIDDNDNIILTGWTTSTDFPTVNPIQPENAGGGNRTPDAFLARLAADGSYLEYSTYLGGSGRDYGDNVAVDRAGNAYLSGYTESTDFPTANAVQGTYAGGFFDGFVTKVNAAGDAFIYSTFLGGDDLEYTYAVDADSLGNAYITGFTLSDDFPTVNAMQPEFGGGVEAYVTKLNPDGSDYVFSTYFGSDDTRGYDLRVLESGYVYVAGSTSSETFPVVNAIQDTFSGTPWDAFVSRFLPDGSALDFSTYLGGNGHEVFHTLTLDNAGNIYFSGWSSSTDFPLVYPIQDTMGSSVDLIVGMIAADYWTLDFSSYFGGSSGEYVRAIAVGPRGRVHLTGRTSSTDFPTLNAFQPELAGGSDGFITSIDLEQVGVTLHIGDLDGRAKDAANDRWLAGVRVLVHDDAEDPVGGTMVNFEVTTDTGAGPFPGDCTTDEDGTCIVTTPRIPSGVGSLTFEVTDATHGSLDYDPLDNHDPDGDSDGTTIVIDQP